MHGVKNKAYKFFHHYMKKNYYKVRVSKYKLNVMKIVIAYINHDNNK